MPPAQPVPRKFPKGQRTTRILGLGSSAIRVRTPSQSPAPSSFRSPSPAVASTQATASTQPTQKARQECKNCGGTNFEDAGNGQTVCTDCGVVLHDSGNYAAEVAFSDDATGRTTQQGTRIGMHQTHQTSYNQNRGGQFGYINQGGGISSADRAKSEANSYFGRLQEPLGIHTLEIHRALNIFTYAYASGFVRGRTIESVATVALYLATRSAKKRLLDQKQQPYSLMLIDFAEKSGMNVFDLGRMMQDMVKKLYLNVGDDEKLKEASLLLQAPGAEALVDKFVDNLDFPPDVAPRIKDDATKILQRMKRDWLHHGRRPSGVCGAAVILAARMNNYRRTLREVVLCAKVTEFTVSKRLEEFQETASSKLSVNDFRIDDVRESLEEMDPPAYSMGLKPKGKKRGRPRKNKAPETATGVEEDQTAHHGDADANNDGDEGTNESEEPPQKRARLDADGFAVPDIPVRATQSAPNQPQAKRGRGKPKGSKNWKAPPATEAEIAYETAIQNEIQEALDDNQDLDVSQPNAPSETPTPEPASADVEVPTQTDPPEPDPSTLPARSDKGNSGNVSLESELGDTEFDDDPEVSTCLLNEAERALKEKIWVTENAEWLRQDHAKRIRRELKDQHLREQGIDPDEMRRQKGKQNLRRKDGARRSGRVGDVGYLNDDFHKKKSAQGELANDGGVEAEGDREGTNELEIGRRASDAVRKMMNQRGVYSRRINYDNLMKSYQMPGENTSITLSPSRSPSRDRTSREDSVISVTSSVGGQGGRETGSSTFRGNVYSAARSKASYSAERREANKKAQRQRATASQSRSPSRALSPEEASATPEPQERASSTRQRSESPEEYTAASMNPPPMLTPPPTQQPQHSKEQSEPPRLPSEEPVSDTDSPLSSTHTPAGSNTVSAINTPPATAPPPPPTSNPSAPSNSKAVVEDQIESDEDDYIEEEEGDDEEDEDDGDDAGSDGVDAALAGQYQGHEWEDELVED